MTSIKSEKRIRKVVPRFRRKDLSKNFVDFDDVEAQALIDQDLKSVYKWNSDLNDDESIDLQNQFQFEDNSQQNLSLIDPTNQENLLDLEVDGRDQVNIFANSDESRRTQYDFQFEHKQIQLFISEKNLKSQRWSIGETRDEFQLNVNDSSEQISKFDCDETNSNELVQFIGDQQFLNERIFSIEEENQRNLFVNDENNLQSIVLDSCQPTINLILSLPQTITTNLWINGQFNLKFSLTQQQQQSTPMFSPLTLNKFELDLANCFHRPSSIDLFTENFISSYLINLIEENKQMIYTIAEEEIRLNLSIDDPNNGKQTFSLDDFQFQQKLSLLSRSFSRQLFSLIDSKERPVNFDLTDRLKLIKWSLENLPNLLLNLCPNETIEQIYSIGSGQAIDLEKMLCSDKDITARSFRRYRCKHLSMQSNENQQFDVDKGFQLVFKSFLLDQQQENEPIEHDLILQQQQFQQFFFSNLILNEEFLRSFDLLTTTTTLKRNDDQPYLDRNDYAIDFDFNLLNKHRQVGCISYDSSLLNPIYYLNKSMKRFVHLPKSKDLSSYDVYEGYQLFIDKVKLNYENYFRPYDSTDLRHLLEWYSNKQSLFSNSNPQLLQTPNFLCRRIVLRTLLTNLYCDSQPWKLLVTRINSQFYLALANQKQNKPEEFTQDEYSGFRFEQLFTTDQPNTTRHRTPPTLDKPQQSFHTIRYWQFGKFNILYSNEIDGEFISQQPTSPSTTTEQTQTTDGLEEETTTTNENKENESGMRNGFVEMKCTNKKIFYRDQNKLQTLSWWAQMWLGDVETLMIGYKANQSGSIEQIDYLSKKQLIGKFLSSYNLRLKYCFSYLYSFLNLIERTVRVDDPLTIHVFSYIPQDLQKDSLTGKAIQTDLPDIVHFQYRQIKRTTQRYQFYIPQSYLDFILRNSSIYQQQFVTLQQEFKKKYSHRGRNTCPLKLNKIRSKQKRKT